MEGVTILNRIRKNNYNCSNKQVRLKAYYEKKL